jgi:type I restriction enzyme, S subunit
MADSLPAGTTFPRGLPISDSIRWPLVPARQLFELKYGKALVEADRRPGIVPVYGTNGRCGNHDKALFTGPGVILGRKGQGPLGVEWCDDDYWVIDTAYSLAPLRSDVDLKYAYFLIKFIGLNHLKDGTSNPTLSRDTFGAQAFPLPPLAVQRAIAHILGTLDDKIELNRRMNATLEEMARTLFKSWFVDFDPVRAKAEGSDPCLPKPLADLFPGSFEDSELGEIPKSWRVTTLGELLELSYGKALKEENRDAGHIPVFGSNGQVGWHNEKLAEGPGIIVGRKGNPGVVTWAPTDFFAIDTTFYVMPKASCQGLHFLYYVLRDHDLASLGADSAVPGLNRNMAYMSQQVLPAPKVLTAFDIRVQSLFTRRYKLDEESRTLAAIRDTLLPKLISGELRVAL